MGSSICSEELKALVCPAAAAVWGGQRLFPPALKPPSGALLVGRWKPASHEWEQDIRSARLGFRRNLYCSEAKGKKTSIKASCSFKGPGRLRYGLVSARLLRGAKHLKNEAGASLLRDGASWSRFDSAVSQGDHDSASSLASHQRR